MELRKAIEICKVHNCEVNPKFAKKCECYKPTPFKENEE